ncbi:hypothetical protein [Streptomyces sp. HNM0574]|uniref:type I-G CRISPR-associated protein, Cas3-extension family n=1 Tax=Streptomyces sp. HNM0574 TaxID=2714954 RepID=UPI00146AC857|nr:hypothetical protein [Streptomyces sp. HNM0574]NLU70863.1 hypothetical protein [Streptomyces sp. HNM0574]
MSQHQVELPALDGRHQLGFLAALGLLRLLTPDDPAEAWPRLSFSRTTGSAILTSHFPDLESITEQLSSIATSVSEDAVLPGVHPDLPFPAGSTGGDPMRPLRGDYRTLDQRIRKIDPGFADRWLPHLVTDQAEDQRGRVALTPYMAPSGKQTVRTFFEKPLGLVRRTPAYLREALVQWRRIPGVTGEYLDHQVLNSAADDPHGESSERGIPGATWLATMALPLLHLSGDGTRVQATLWHTIANRPVMIWPLWHTPLTVPSVQAVLDHPALRPLPTTDRNTPPTLDPTLWQPLSIFTAGAARRVTIPGRKSAGVLTSLNVRVHQAT